MGGATVTHRVVKPDLAILFEGSPSDDFFFSATQAQGRMKTAFRSAAWTRAIYPIRCSWNTPWSWPANSVSATRRR